MALKIFKMKKEEAIYQYCVRLGDNALIMGHRLSEICSRGPFLEEDLALTNFALDMIGRAQALLGYAAELKGGKETADSIAYRREERDYRNHLITELPNGDFANVVARLLYVSAYDYLLFKELEKSMDTTLSGIASKAVKESKYHFQHMSDWTIRLGDGTQESHSRIQKAFNRLYMYSGEMFEMDEVELLLLREGIAADTIPLKSEWEQTIANILAEATLGSPNAGFMQTGSRKGIHTEHLGHILCEMQYLQRTYPDASW
jgi:ring-1,2-phenylacetyl-CoA epoxidase subunit PaaC